MNTNLSTQSILTESSSCTAPVTRGMMRDRAVELAAIDGRPPQETSKFDWEQAKHEMQDEPGFIQDQMYADSLPQTYAIPGDGQIGVNSTIYIS